MFSAWEQESYYAWNDIYLIILFTTLWPSARWALDHIIYEFFGQRSVAFKGFSGNDRESQEGRRKILSKFKESCWKLTYYFILELYALCITYPEAWFGNTAAFWYGWPNQSLKYKLKLYYVGQTGFYLYSIAALMFWETRRKDFGVMMTHHFVTLGLLVYSYLTGSFRVGSIVLALHDASDICLEGAKLFKYCDNELGASLLFGLFALSWMALRLVYFPFWIIWSTSSEVLRLVPKTPWLPSLYYQFNTMLIMLLVVHIYWWVLIFRMIVRQLKNAGRVEDDIRSDSDDD